MPVARLSAIVSRRIESAPRRADILADRGRAAAAIVLSTPRITFAGGSAIRGGTRPAAFNQESYERNGFYPLSRRYLMLHYSILASRWAIGLHDGGGGTTVKPKATIAALAVILSVSLITTPAVARRIAEKAASVLVEDARIQSAPGVVLAATLRVPAQKRPHPVLIIQSGSGPSKRGGYVPLEHRLNDIGIATIEFDKRGVGQSTGALTDTMQDMEADISATIAWLRKRPDIDGSRIALLGHSQGAAAVPIVADRDGHIAAIVFLAGPVGQRGTMFLEDMRRQLVEGGHAPDLADRVTVATGRWMEERSRGAHANEVLQARSAVVAEFMHAGFSPEDAESATKILDTPQVLSMYQVAPGTALAHLKIPVLAIFGARDEIVGPQSDAAAAAMAENPKAVVLEIPGASHGFGYRPLGAPARESPGGGPWLSLLPKALITDWLKEWLIDPPPVDRWEVN